MQLYSDTSLYMCGLNALVLVRQSEWILKGESICCKSNCNDASIGKKVSVEGINYDMSG